MSTATTGQNRHTHIPIESVGGVEQCSIIHASQKPSPLLRLPAELRTEIYAFALGGNTWMINMNQAKSRTDGATPHALALLRVNRQIHTEAHLVPYAYNTFECRRVDHLRTWVESLSQAQRRSITSVKHFQPGYIIERVIGVDVNPVFWVETPNMTGWELEGLKRIEVEVVLLKWGWATSEEKAEKARVQVVSQLRALVENNHPDIVVEIVSKSSY